MRSSVKAICLLSWQTDPQGRKRETWCLSWMRACNPTRPRRPPGYGRFTIKQATVTFFHSWSGSYLVARFGKIWNLRIGSISNHGNSVSENWPHPEEPCLITKKKKKTICGRNQTFTVLNVFSPIELNLPQIICFKLTNLLFTQSVQNNMMILEQ